MAGNSYGTLFRVTTFGESHGEALGGIIDGCPSGIEINLAIQLEMSRRKPVSQQSLPKERTG
jgi:chorismate synthase